MRWLLACTLVVGCGPGDGTGAPDLAVESDLAMATCAPEFGRVYFVDKLEFLPSAEGFDLTGDGTIDNSIGAFATLANPEMAKSIASGSTMLLMTLSGLKGPPLVEDDMPQLAIYVGLDADVPADPSNNAMNGAFHTSIEQFDVNCRSATTYDSSVVRMGALVSNSRKLDVVAGGIGTITFLDAQQRSVPEQPDFSAWSARAGGVVPACSFALTAFPGDNPASLIDVMVNAFNIQPDIDRDGDGLETITGDGLTIKECRDGDGTIIPGLACPCDPRMRDAYSGAIAAHLVPARIVGVVMPP